jgi:O-antigen/teichoic acid export membrane protein
MHRRPCPQVSETPTSDTNPRPEAPSHLEHSVRAGVAWKFAGQLGVQSTRLVTVVILARLLDPADYGAAAIAVVIASFAPTLGDFGMGSALVQTTAATQAVRSTAFWGSAAFGVGMSVLFVLFAKPVGRFLDDPGIGTMAAVGGLTLAIYSLGSTSQAMFMRAMNFRTLELRYLLGLAVASAVAIVAAAAGLGAWALVIQQVVLITGVTAALWWHTDWHPTLEFSREVFRQLFSFAVRLGGARCARLLELLVLSLLIGRLVGVPDLGTWAFSMSTVIVPLTVIAIPIAEVLFAAFSRLQGERERIAALWLDSIGLLAAVILPLLAGLVIVAPELIPLVFGSQWDVAVPVIQILSIYVMIRTLQSWNSVVLDAAGRPHITFWTQAAALCLTPVAVVVGAQWGIEGVAICFVVAQLIAVEIPSFLFVFSELQLRPGMVAVRLSGVVAATAVMAVACGLGRLAFSRLGVGMAGEAALIIAIGLLVYPVALSLFAPDMRRRAVGLLKRGLIRSRVVVARRSAS